MKTRNTHQVNSLDDAFTDFRNLKDFADRLKRPPKIIDQNAGETPKKEAPLSEAPGNSYFDLQAKYKTNQTATQVPDSEILKFLYKQAACSFTTASIICIANSFGVSEAYIRSLIASITVSRYKR